MELHFKLELFGLRPACKMSEYMLIPGNDNHLYPACLIDVSYTTYKVYHISISIWSQYFKSKKIG